MTNYPKFNGDQFIKEMTLSGQSRGCGLRSRKEVLRGCSTAPFVDIHAHNAGKEDTSITLLNFVVGRDKNLPSGLFSAGIHPWYLIDLEHQKEMLLQLAKRQECLAIGECGLDKVRGGDWKEQEELFVWHIKLSEALKKPLIIHCVKSFETILKLHKELKPIMPWIIHGFQGKKELAKQLLSKGVFLSYGVTMLDKSKNQLRESLLQTPVEQLFLESDDWQGDIARLFKKVSEIKGIGVNSLMENIYMNYRRVFR